MNDVTLAREFCNALRDQLPAVAMDTVNARNSEELNPSICHSHDFCDANQVMLDAGEALGIDLDPQDEAHGKLIDSAWSMAKEAEFNAERIMATDEERSCGPRL